jgi:hypothetical protein
MKSWTAPKKCSTRSKQINEREDHEREDHEREDHAACHFI